MGVHDGGGAMVVVAFCCLLVFCAGCVIVARGHRTLKRAPVTADSMDHKAFIPEPRSKDPSENLFW
jgi:hypothetical protein